MHFCRENCSEILNTLEESCCYVLIHSYTSLCYYGTKYICMTYFHIFHYKEVGDLSFMADISWYTSSMWHTYIGIIIVDNAFTYMIPATNVTLQHELS